MNLKMLYLDYEDYLNKVLRCFNMENCKQLICPKDENEIKEM